MKSSSRREGLTAVMGFESGTLPDWMCRWKRPRSAAWLPIFRHPPKASEISPIGKALVLSEGAFPPRRPTLGCAAPLAISRSRSPLAAATLVTWRQAITPQHGGDRKSEHRMIKSDDIPLDGRNTSRAYLVARLETRRPPELAAANPGLSPILSVLNASTVASIFVTMSQSNQ